MIVVAVLMMSCHVSRLPNTKYVGAQMTIRRTQKAKKVARLAMSAAHPAKRSKNPTRLDTWLGISTGWSCPFLPWPLSPPLVPWLRVLSWLDCVIGDLPVAVEVL